MAHKDTFELFTLWNSLLSKENLISCDQNDELLLKVTLLTQATMKLFRSLRERELQALEHFSRKEASWEKESAVLNKEISNLKKKLSSAQQQAETASLKYGKLKGAVSEEVESRLRSMFHDSLQKNRTATNEEVVFTEYDPPLEPKAPSTGASSSKLENKASRKNKNELSSTGWISCRK